jgi:type VI secretion system VasD/TssJ family lipoprotein
MKSLLSVLLIAFLLTSCSSNQPEPIILNLVINASDDINPSPFSAANPVVINLYQLTALDDFNSAQVLDLYQQDTKFLAATLIQKQNLYSFLPNEQKNYFNNNTADNKFFSCLRSIFRLLTGKNKSVSKY